MSSIYGSRAGVPDIVLLVTSGDTILDIHTTVSNAISLRQQGAYVIILSIGNIVNRYVLESIASEPTNQTIVYAYSSASLQPGLMNSIYSLMTSSKYQSVDSMCFVRNKVNLYLVTLFACEWLDKIHCRSILNISPT